MWDATTATLDELLEALQEGSETLGEFETQARSETALYGDAWPGAWVQIGEIRHSLKTLTEVAKQRFPEAFKPMEAADPNMDIPF